MKALLVSTIIAAAVAEAASGVPAVTLTAKPERDYLNSAKSRDCVVQIELTGRRSSEERKMPINLAIVLDRSGSMEGAKLGKARQAACLAIDRLGASDIFSLVTYDDQVDVLIPPKTIGSDDGKRQWKSLIRGIEAGGSTALHAGVQKGAQQLRKYLDDERVNRVMLLSDGLANVGPSTPGKLAALGKELRKEGISVTTIGVGDDYNEDLMTALAEASRANYYYVKDAEKLPGIFEEELGMVKTIVARKIELILTFPNGVRPTSVLGEDDIVIRGPSVTIPVEDLSGSQSRRFLVACEAPQRDEGELELASAEVKYLDPAANRIEAQSAVAKVRFTKDPEKADKSGDDDVLGNVAVSRNVVAKQRAVALADEGKSADAAKILREQAAANAQLPAAAASALAKDENAELERKAGELETSGSLGKASRKEFQYQNYQDRKQKR